MTSPEIVPLPRPAWVTADTHFGHANILDYCPWRKTWAQDIDAHDQTIIAAWNRVVAQDDWVLHLGDVSLSKSVALADYRKRLHGRICLIRGNHDRSGAYMRRAGFDMVTRYGTITTDQGTWLCVHDPAHAVNALSPDIIGVLHGHCHGSGHRETWAGHDGQATIDCGVDALQSVAPCSFDTLLAKHAELPQD
ncbi:MAG: hypothetical protein EA401_06065 [Planctomycetota bacterium]|nr:MAG: hypothetical protein EA401_06065 [Planctomycetota bacterium]